MFDTLLQTKLYMPALRRDWVPRPRLLAKLAIQPQTRLVLVSAPAGYGKTTLVTAWLRQLAAAGEAQVCWLALDEEDSDPQQFFRYLAAAVQPLPGLQTALPTLLQTNQAVAANTLQKAFVQDVTAVSVPFLLVLDDYHALDSAEIEEGLAALLERMPPQMTLVLTSRSDPGFPISRLRARGQLIELRAADLRFTEAEAARFLQHTMGLSLSPAQTAALEQRTEGWVAGLQMAALSMQNRAGDDLAAFVANFTGSHRFVLDYLVEEALHQQPDSVRTFLLATSLLDRLNGPLCEAVTGQANGQALLARLERDNLFVVPLDDERHWYRYHHLFADALQSRGLAEQPEQVAVWHQRASRWYAQHNAPGEAIRHALVAADYERAAELAELSGRTMDRSYQSAVWLGWVASLPSHLVRARPVLCMTYAWALLGNGRLEAADSYLEAVEEWLAAIAAENGNRPAGMGVTDEEGFKALPLTIANARTYQAQARGDVPGTVKYTQQTLALLPEGDYFERGITAALLGLAHWSNGDLEPAYRAISDGIAYMRLADNMLYAISGTQPLADIRIAQGRLREAATIYEQALQLAGEQSEQSEQGEPAFQVMADLYLGLSELCFEQGDLEAAKQHLQRSQTLGEPAALPRWPYRCCCLQARLKAREGDLDGAVALFEEAERLFFRHAVPDVRPAAVLKARVWIAQGALDKAAAWVQAQGLSPADDLSYLRECEHLTLVRLLLARRVEPELTEALALLARLLAAAEAGGRTGSVLEILVLQALVQAAQNDRPAALASLERALTLAEPQGYISLFVTEGPPLASLLRTAAKTDFARPYLFRLLAAFGDVAVEPAAGPDGASPLIDPLSERELEILALIAAGLKNKEIADQLVISLNTVLYHIKNIYGKLGVSKRALAIARARELDLL